MALVTDRLNANKPATPEPKQGKINPAQLNNNKDLEVDMKKEEPSFFGSFFSSSKSQQQKAKKGPQAMEAASIFFEILLSRAYVSRTATASHPSTSHVERP